MLVELKDNVLWQKSAFVRRSVFSDARDEDTRFAHLNLDTEPAARDFPVRDNFLRNRQNRFNRNSESHPRLRHRWDAELCDVITCHHCRHLGNGIRQNCQDHPDNLACGIDDCAAAVAGRDRRVDFDDFGAMRIGQDVPTPDDTE